MYNFKNIYYNNKTNTFKHKMITHNEFHMSIQLISKYVFRFKFDLWYILFSINLYGVKGYNLKI